MRALIVDDSRAMRLILKRLLNECGYDEIVEAGNGVEALEALNGGLMPDLALVDWSMPEMNGVQFVGAARAIPEYRGVLIMMVSTETGPERVAEALAAGANEYVMKPFTRDVLLTKLDLLRSAH